MQPTASLRSIAKRFVERRRADDGRLEASIEDIERLLSDVVGRTWTDASINLPPQGRRMIFFSSYTCELHVGTFLQGRWFDEEDHEIDGTAVEVTEVTHWMRLPYRPTIHGQTNC